MPIGEDPLPDFVQNDLAFACASCTEQTKTYYIVARKVQHCDKTLVMFKLCGRCYVTTNGGAA